LKVLDKFIIRAFLPPFAGAFMVTWFIFIMQFMWVWIDEFIGKGLDTFTILQFLGLLSTTLVPIALPLGILFAALMTFGNLGETSELVAVKSSGASIVRFFKPLLMLIVVITVFAFLFNNYIIPRAQLKATRLLYDIQNKKPVVAIKAGRFYKDIPNTTIYISRKDADDITVHDIKIYDHTSGRGNDKMTFAEKGKMYVSKDKRYLIFELENGWRYEDKLPKGKDEHEQIRFGFRYWKKVFDLSDFKMPKTDENYFKTLRGVMTVEQIAKQIDTSKKALRKQHENNKALLMPGITYVMWDTAINKKVSLPRISSKMGIKDTGMICLIPDSLKKRVITTAEIAARSVRSMMEINKQNQHLQEINLNENYIEMHKRFTIPFACILLFLIGSALGSIIRKGGIGMPFIAAVVFFIIYYFLNTIGEKIAKEQVVPVWFGLWMPSLLLILLGVFLMYKANVDSPLLNKEWYYRTFGSFIEIFKVKKK
jgi:lipopolysaccharide export system permease protein